MNQKVPEGKTKETKTVDTTSDPILSLESAAEHKRACIRSIEIEVERLEKQVAFERDRQLKLLKEADAFDAAAAKLKATIQ
jgi:hypothetical protein